MARKISLFLVLSLVMVGLFAITADAKNRVVNERLERLSQYEFLYKPARASHADVVGNTGRGIGGPSGLATNLGTSPGIQLGFTYYEAQQNSSLGRLVDWRGNSQVHFAWMFAPSNDIAAQRTVAYNVYNGIDGNFPLGAGVGCPVAPPATIRAGFANLDVRPADVGNPDEYASAVYTGHFSPMAGSEEFLTAVFWDQATQSFGFCDWSVNLYVDSAQDASLTLEAGAHVIWPKLEYQISGTDTITYACSYGSADVGLDQIVVFRTEGELGGVSWTATVIDTTFFPMQDITSARGAQKVAVVYTLPSAGTSADGESNERDVYYRESTDLGLSWGPKVNITEYNDAVAGHRAWLEVSCLYDSNDNLHVIWNASVFVPGEGAGSRACRLFHWADHTDIIGTVYNAEWDPLDADCVMGFNVMNVGKFTISECDTNLYVIWSQANDPDNGLIDDCANPDVAPANVAGNAEIYLSVSGGLDGLGWDAPRNLTQSYSPGCDTAAGNECDSDNWASMSRYGMDNAAVSFNDAGAAGALTVDPSGGSYTGDYYLDVQYVNDLFPSAGVYEGTPDILLPNPVRWFRLPCVDPIVQSNISVSPSGINYPFYLQHGETEVVPVTIENSGNTGATGTISTFESTGPAGWLAIDLGSFNIPSAIGNFDTVNVTLNNGGVVNNPGTIVNLEGLVIFDVDAPTVRDSVAVNINFPVADTVVGLSFGTISTSCISLIGSNNGNLGNAGNAPDGGANMNFAADCDQNDTIPGDASVYLYDGSPVVLRVAGTDTLASWSIFGSGFATANAFKPIESDPAPGTFSGSNYDAYYSGKFVTADSSLTLEKTIYAPSAGDSCNFIIQTLCIYSTDGSAQSGLAIGEAWDWDVPSDTAVRNSAGSDPFEEVVWLQGGEWDDAGVGDSLECQQNDARFGGAGLIGYMDGSGTTIPASPANLYTALNEDFVIPSGGFIPEELYENMQTNSGITVVPSSTIEDQHMVMTVFKNYNLAANDTLVIHIAMATVENGSDADMVQAIVDARAWFNANAPLPKQPSSGGCCTGLTGDVNNSGDPATLTDLTLLVNRLFVTFIEVPCPAEANTSGDAGCAITLTDLTLLVNRLFVTFVPTADCATFDQSNCPPQP